VFPYEFHGRFFNLFNELRPILEKTQHKKRLVGVAQGVGPEFKPQHHKKTV
jgi:hypothetical protein